MTGEAELRRGQPVGAAMVAIGGDLLARISLSAEKADAVAIHDFRLAAKRWRAYLRLIEPFAGNEALELRHLARDVARSLASARDAQAARDALDDLGKDYATLSPRSLATVTRRLEALRASAEQATLTAEIRDRILDLQSRSIAALNGWAWEKATFRDVAEGLAAGYRRARKAMPSDWSAAAPEDLHELRSRVVVHRYQMEVIRPLWPRLGKVWIGEAQRLRERLGKNQDLAVLRKLMLRGQPLARWNRLLAPAIEARQRDHIDAAMRLATRLFAERPRHFRRRLEAMWGPQAA